jgi:hypothetical protein
VTRRALIGAAGAFALVALFPTQAAAHGLVGRTDLPVPSWLFGWGAAIVLVVSFLALALLWPEPRLQRPVTRPLFRMPAAVDPLCGAAGVALFVLVVYSGLAGTQETASNFAPTFVYVHFWVGLAVASVLFGDIFRAFNPWLAIGSASSWVLQRTMRRRPFERLGYPDRLGCWPAVAGLLGFVWLELAYIEKGDPSTLAILSLVYAAIQLAGMALFGVERWSRAGDGFGVYYSLLSHLSPFERREGVVHLRRPLSGAPSLPIMAGSVALLCVAIGSTTFDGFSNGPVWSSIGPDIRTFFSDLGAGEQTAVQWASTVGLIGCILAVALFYRLGVIGMRTVGEGHTARELAGRFVHTLIPIAFAYALAHYFSLLMFQGQAGGYLISDPLGEGSDLFGTADIKINYNAVSTNAIWYVQVGALVCGHIAGLVLAHDRAVALYRKVQDATHSQYWMLVVMVGFTSLGLWLLSAVNE